MEALSNHDERVVKIEVKTARRTTRIGFAIHDSRLGYWRGTSALTDYDAWTRDTKKRAVFPNRTEAACELMAIRLWRNEREDFSGDTGCHDLIAA